MGYLGLSILTGSHTLHAARVSSSEVVSFCVVCVGLAFHGSAQYNVTDIKFLSWRWEALLIQLLLVL